MSNKTKNPYLLTLPELISAKKKISKVAAFYDPAKKGLRGFDSTALDATEFREQLRRNFLVKLTDAELGAIVFLFDQDGDRQVDSVEFINEFLRLGNLEKSRIRFESEEAKKKIEIMKQKEQERARLKQERLTSIKIATSWTPEDEESAVAKIAHVAFTYDSMKGGLAAFLNADSLTQTEFKEQLRRVFAIHLTPEETAALTNIYDKYHNGEVDTKEFVYHFFRTRRSELDYHNSRQAYMTEQKHKMDKQRHDEAVERFAKMTIAKTTPCTEEERQSALDKIRLAAAWYRKSPFIDAIQKSFEAEELAPTAFKELLFNNFEIRLSPGELDAVVKLFDLNCDGNISCVEFMTTFHKIGSQERMRILHEKRRKDHQLAEAEKERRKHLDEAIQSLTMTKVKWPELPAFDEDVELSTNSSLVAGETDVAMADLTLAHFKKRKSRKPSTMEILAPDKFASKLANTNRSFNEIFPKASDSTKDFIRELEGKEREIRKWSASDGASLRSSSSLSKGVRSSMASIDSLGSGTGGNAMSDTSSTATGMSAHKAARRVSKKAPMDNGTKGPRNSVNQRPPMPNAQQIHQQQQQHAHGKYGGNAAAAHAMLKNDGGMSRQSTASSVYSEYDSFDPTAVLPREGSTLPQETNLMVFGDEPYEEVEATLPPIEFDRPRTVHSHSRPGSSRSQTKSRGNDSGFEQL